MIERYFEGIQMHIRGAKRNIREVVLLPGELERVEEIANYLKLNSRSQVSRF